MITSARDNRFLSQHVLCDKQESGNHQMVFKEYGEGCSSCNFSPTVNFGGGSLMVRGRINLNATAGLVIVDGD